MSREFTKSEHYIWETNTKERTYSLRVWCLECPDPVSETMPFIPSVDYLMDLRELRRLYANPKPEPIDAIDNVPESELEEAKGWLVTDCVFGHETWTECIT